MLTRLASCCCTFDRCTLCCLLFIPESAPCMRVFVCHCPAANPPPCLPQIQLAPQPYDIKEAKEDAAQALAAPVPSQNMYF